MAKKSAIVEELIPVVPETESAPAPEVVEEPKQEILEMHINKLHDLRFVDDAGFTYRLEDYKGVGTYWLVQV